MPITLTSEHIDLEIELPLEGYQFPRFDQTGKIKAVRFKGLPVTGREKINHLDEKFGGCGLFNEFGIDGGLGFEETKRGDWFHKIGVGLLKKDADSYHFQNRYKLKSATFSHVHSDVNASFSCIGSEHDGYAYKLHKTIAVENNGFIIQYQLINTGEKTIETSEYCHNFLAVNNNPIGPEYKLQLAGNIKRLANAESVHAESIAYTKNEMLFKAPIAKEFFLSDLSGQETVPAQWVLIDRANNISVKEIGSFTTNRINIWGNNHVICPELFYSIQLAPGQEMSWKRTYEINSISAD